MPFLYPNHLTEWRPIFDSAETSVHWLFNTVNYVLITYLTQPARTVSRLLKLRDHRWHCILTIIIKDGGWGFTINYIRICTFFACALKLGRRLSLINWPVVYIGCLGKSTNWWSELKHHYYCMDFALQYYTIACVATLTAELTKPWCTENKGSIHEQFATNWWQYCHVRCTNKVDIFLMICLHAHAVIITIINHRCQSRFLSVLSFVLEVTTVCRIFAPCPKQKI